MTKEDATTEPQPDPLTDDEDAQDDSPIGGEIRVTGGGAPRVFQWAIYLVYIWAIVYLVVHPSVPHREIILAFAALIGAWLVFFALTKRPPEL